MVGCVRVDDLIGGHAAEAGRYGDRHEQGGRAHYGRRHWSQWRALRTHEGRHPAHFDAGQGAPNFLNFPGIRRKFNVACQFIVIVIFNLFEVFA